MSDMPEVFTRTRPTARKEHRCYECTGMIQKGEKYVRNQGLWSGEWDTFKVCTDCEETRAVVDRDEKEPDFQTAFGHLCESVFDSDHEEAIPMYLNTRRKRGVPIPDWMLEREKDLKP